MNKKDMDKRVAVLILVLVFSLATLSCSNEALPPLEGEPAELAAEFVDDLAGGSYEECTRYFNLRMKRTLSARKLEQAWIDLLEQTGPYESQSDMREESVDGYLAVTINAQFGKDTAKIRIVFDENRHISGLWFKPDRKKAAGE